jgi:diguanylate cyclase (GGDEF)-like protein/PAS domain S-box-containing protein
MRLARYHESHRITIIGGLILIALTLASGIAVYALMQQQAESILVRSLETSLQSNRRQFESEIGAGMTRALTVSTRPFVIHNLALLKADAANPDARQALQRIAHSFLPTGLSGVAFHDANGTLVAQAGRLSPSPQLSVPLNTPTRTHLLWDDKLILLVVRDVLDEQNNHIGMARTESTLPNLTRLIAEANAIGATAELRVCAAANGGMECFPFAGSRQLPQRLPRTLEGKPLPMSHALDGRSGAAFARDHRHQPVVVAYAPLSDLGLGMALKIDQAELFGPVKRQLRFIVPLLAGLVAAGVLLLYWLVAPLVRKLADSERRMGEVNARLRDVEERWRFALDSTGAGVWDVDVPSNRILLSRRCKEMLGFAEDEIDTRVDGWMQLIHHDDLPGIETVRRQLGSGEHDTFDLEHRMQARDGSWKWIHARGLVVARDADNRPLRLIGTYLDVSERKQAEETIRQHADFDPLTHLPNRRLFLDRLQQEMAKAQRAGSSLALLLVDLDHFKEVNDTLGHDTGDTLLQEAAQRIRDCVRHADTVARLGGDEFTVILTELADHSHAEDIAQKIIGRLAEPFRLGSESAYVSASVGITLYPIDACDIDTLMKHADQAMYAAKRQGRNRFCYFTPSLQESAQTRMRLGRDLREAVSGGQFALHFQPIVELASGRIRKAEALLRWQHPERGPVNPTEFIPLAEETGLIHAIGDWTFEESARRLKQWGARLGDDFRISINLSPAQFRVDGRIHAQAWLKHFQALGLPCRQLVLEITEGLLLNMQQEITDTLFAFREAGIQIAIDDFGTGYSTLSYLKQLPIDYVKIDRSFVSDLETDPNNRALSKAIIVMAHELGMRVIAEGVETAEQRALLQEAGCDCAQGNFFAAPLAADAFETLLQRS